MGRLCRLRQSDTQSETLSQRLASGNREFIMEQSRTGRTRCRARGQAIIEMAFVLTILLSIVIGIVEFGHAYMVLNVLTTASRESARFAAVKPDLATNDPLVVQRARDILMNAGVDIGTFGLQVTNTKPARRGDLVTVTVKLPSYQPISGAGGFINMGTIPLQEVTTMRWEG